MAVKHDGYALQFASEDLKNDRELVLAAVNRSSQALSFSSERLRNDREVVLAAVSKQGNEMRYASEELKNDNEILIVAVANGWKVWNEEFKDLVETAVLDFRVYHDVFLRGWSLVANKSREYHLLTLNKLGFYKSIEVKKLIADYAGVRYGARLHTARRALGVVNNKEYEG
jgi:hypothetical protein